MNVSKLDNAISKCNQQIILNNQLSLEKV